MLLTSTVVEILLAHAPPERWGAARSEEQRYDIFGELLGALKQESGVEAGLDLLPPWGDLRGRYDYDNRRIKVVRDLLFDFRPTRPLGTLVHEFRHATQYQCADSSGVDPELAGRWRHGISELAADKARGAALHNYIEMDASLEQHMVLVAYWDRSP